jgi:hypothetical protein
VPLECVASHAGELGDPCVGGAECSSGLCQLGGGTLGKCSACLTSADCPGGETCAPGWTQTVFGPAAPDVCAPGMHLGAPGAGCGGDGDCASGHCNGTERSECPDGRACATPVTCPADGNLDPGACTQVGIQGGSCQ